MITYYWTWDGHAFCEKTKDIDTKVEGGWAKYFAVYNEHHGSNADFCEFFKSAIEEAKKHLTAPVIKGLKMQLPALEAGDMDYITLGKMVFYTYDDKEAKYE